MGAAHGNRYPVEAALQGARKALAGHSMPSVLIGRPILSALIYHLDKASSTAEQLDMLSRDVGRIADEERQVKLQKALGLPPSAARLLLTMWNKSDGLLLKDTAILVLYFSKDEPEGGDRVLVQFIHQIRRKLGSGAIDNVWGKGWVLTAAGRERVDAALAAPLPQPVLPPAPTLAHDDCPPPGMFVRPAEGVRD